VAVSEAAEAVAKASAGVGLGEERKKLNIEWHWVEAHSMKNQLENGVIGLDRAQIFI
jgi:hypothetical protein